MRIFVKVREESCVVILPVLRHSHPRIVEVRTRLRIKRTRRPEANQNHYRHRNLRPYLREPQKEKKNVAEPDLRECVLKRPVSLTRLQGAKENSEKNEQQPSPRRMPNHMPKALPFGFPACDREW